MRDSVDLPAMSCSAYQSCNSCTGLLTAPPYLVTSSARIDYCNGLLLLLHRHAWQIWVGVGLIGAATVQGIQVVGTTQIVVHNKVNVESSNLL